MPSRPIIPKTIVPCGSGVNTGYVASTDYNSGVFQQLLEPVPQAAAFFGLSHALSANGEYLITAAPNFYFGVNVAVGDVYLHTRSGGLYDAGTLLTPPAGTVDSDHFATAIAISGDGNWIFVSAPDYGSDEGRVYVYERSTLTHVQTLGASLTAPVTQRFGWNIFSSRNGRYLMSSAPAYDPSENAFIHHGRVVIYYDTSVAGDWSAFSTYTLPDPPNGSPPGSGRYFGISSYMTPDANLALVAYNDNAGQQAVAVYERTANPNTWTHVEDLVSPDNPAGSDYFGNVNGFRPGFPIAANRDGEHLVIGAYNWINAIPEYSGALYYFRRSGGAYNYKQRLEPDQSNPSYSLLYGFDLSMSYDGQLLLAGAQGENYGANTEAGAHYLYSLQTGQYGLRERLNPDPQPYAYYAYSVGLAGDNVYLSAGATDYDDTLSSQGAMYAAPIMS